MASVSPRHDTHPLIAASGRFSVSILAGDQIEQGQYFSYPGRRMRYVADEYLDVVDGLPRVRECVAWLACEVEDRITGRYDHDLFFARVTAWEPGRLGEAPLLYSSRLGWAHPRARRRGARPPAGPDRGRRAGIRTRRGVTGVSPLDPPVK